MTAASDINGLPCFYEWEFDMKSGALAGAAAHPNLAGMLLDDSVCNGEPQAGTACLAFLGRVLRRKKWIVNLINMFGSNSCAGVADTHLHAQAVRGFDAQCAAVYTHGVFRVQEKVEKYLL